MLTYIKELAIIPPDPCEKLAVVVTYNRKEFVSKWLKAWNNAEHYGVKLAVIHTFEGDKPNQDEMENILQYKPTYYIPVHNSILRDFGPLMMVLKNLTELPNWEYLFWFTDDMLPMRRTFLRPFVEKIIAPDVGLVAQCYEPKTTSGGGGHIRTIAYATKREVTDKLKLPDPKIHGGNCGFAFEYHAGSHILEQVTNLGYRFELAHGGLPDSLGYQHWTSFLDWMWDCHLLGSWTEYWDVYEEQFKSIQRIENASGKIETLLSIGECEKRTLSQKKLSFLIEYSYFSSSCDFVTCIASILNNFPNKYLEEIIIGIHGNDEDVLDQKQIILQEIKKNCSTIPISFIRTSNGTKSSIIKDQLVLMCKSESYALLDDTVKIEKGDWEKHIDNFFSNDNLAIICWQRNNATKLKCENEKMQMPSISDKFIICKKHIMKEINASWEDYEIEFKFGISNFVSYKKFIQWHEKNKNIIGRLPEEDKYFEKIVLKSGSFVIDKIINNNYEIDKIDAEMIVEINESDCGIFRNTEIKNNFFVNIKNIIEMENLNSQEQVTS